MVYKYITLYALAAALAAQAAPLAPGSGSGTAPTATPLAVWQRPDKNFFDTKPANGGTPIAYFDNTDSMTYYGATLLTTETEGSQTLTHTITALVGEQTATSTKSGQVVTVTDADVQLFYDEFVMDFLVREGDSKEPEEPLDGTFCQLDGSTGACWLLDFDGTTIATDYFNIIAGKTSTISVQPMASATHLTKGYVGEMVSRIIASQKESTTTTQSSTQTTTTQSSTHTTTTATRLAKREITTIAEVTGTPTPMATRKVRRAAPPAGDTVPAI